MASQGSEEERTESRVAFASGSGSTSSAPPRPSSRRQLQHPPLPRIESEVYNVELGTGDLLSGYVKLPEGYEVVDEKTDGGKYSELLHSMSQYARELYLDI